MSCKNEVLSCFPRSGFFVLPTPPIFLATGSQTLRYLHARTTQDLKLLGTGDSCLAGCLDGQGKTQAIITIQCLEPETSYLIIADGGELEEVRNAILQFRVTEQIALDPIPNTAIVHLFGVAPDFLELSHQPIHIIPSVSTIYPGWDLCFPTATLHDIRTELQNVCNEISNETWKAFRIASRRFHFPHEIQPGKTFLESAPSSALTIGKGCYPGQEVVEKTLARGKSPFQTLPFFIRSNEATEEGSSVYESNDVSEKASSRPFGQIISIGALPNQQGQCAAVRIRNTQEPIPSTLYLSNGTSLELIPAL